MPPSTPSWLALLALLALVLPSNALYFYMDGRQTRCFFEELPKDTLVVGQLPDPRPQSLVYPTMLTRTPGNYKTEVLNTQTNLYAVDASLRMQITVDETFDNDHRVVSKRDGNAGRFTFSAADPGQHKICLTPDTQVATGGWLNGGAPGGVRVDLDMAIGETSKIETEDKGQMEDIVRKVRDLNGRLQDIRREQVFQRVRVHCICT